MAEESYKYIGKSCVTLDARRKVTGDATYVGDLDIGAALVGKIVRSPHPHARILSIDVNKARKVEGVKAIITADDLPDVRGGTGIYDQPLLARGVVRHVGEAVVAIAAVSEQACNEAAGLIEIEYEPLAAVFDAEAAIAEGQPVILHPDASSYVRVAKWPPDLGRPNLSGCWGLKRGDVEKGFAESHLILENTFRTSSTQHAPIEPHSTLVRPEPDGGLTVWSATRTPGKVHHEVARGLKIPASKIRLVTVDVGGSFGGKSDGQIDVIAAWLAHRSRMPVKLILDRGGEFVTVTKHGFTIKIKDGVSRDGIIQARKMEVILNGGAYSGAPVPRNSVFAVETYKIKNLEVNAYRAYTNLPLAASSRGFGITDVTTAVEQQMEILAEKLGMDSVEFRLKNLCVQGDVNNLGEKIWSLGSRDCLITVSEALKPFAKKGKAVDGPWKRGFGIAVGQKYSQAPTQSQCEARLYPDGSVDVFVGGMDTGQGFFTVMTQIAAEVMDTPIEKIHVRGREMGLPPIYDVGALSSRQTFNTGNAVRLALVDLKKKVFDLVHKAGEAPQDLRYSNGAIYAAAATEPLLRSADLFRDYADTHGPRKMLRHLSDEGGLVGRAMWVVETSPMDPRDSRLMLEGNLGKEPRVNSFYTPAVAGVEVLVNIETGEVRVVRLLCAVEGGKVINPSLAEAQVEGAACMGLGAVLMEEMYRDGKVKAGGFIDYPLPTTADFPRVENFNIFLLESPQPDGPFGAKGLAEAAMVVTPAAVANAICAATGCRMKEIPITPERVLGALKGTTPEEKTVFCFSRSLRELATPNVMEGAYAVVSKGA